MLILGDMREFGTAAEELHRRSAEQIAHSRVDLVVAVGDYAKMVAKIVQTASDGRIQTHAYASVPSAKRRVVSLLRGGDTILVKASRAVGLEKIVEAIRERSAGSVKSKPAAKHATVKSKPLGRRGTVRGAAR